VGLEGTLPRRRHGVRVAQLFLGHLDLPRAISREERKEIQMSLFQCPLTDLLVLPLGTIQEYFELALLMMNH
jgi:hypothetical protein